jgi:hypothetical protein
MTVVWILTWIGQSVALVALTSVFVRLSGWRANASARSAAWTVADGSVASGSCTLDENTPWWGRAAALGAATGEGAATAGRTTASFPTRLGTRVSQSFTR